MCGDAAINVKCKNSNLLINVEVVEPAIVANNVSNEKEILL